MKLKVQLELKNEVVDMQYDVLAGLDSNSRSTEAGRAGKKWWKIRG